MWYINFFFALLFISCSSISHAATYDESIDGELSHTGLETTYIPLDEGSNLISGRTGNHGHGVDLDYFTISTPAGYELQEIKVLPSTSVGGSESFIGIQSGGQITVPSDTGSAKGLMGWWLFGYDDIDQNILAKMAEPANGSSGFTLPLKARTYSFWVQELSRGSYNYELEFKVGQQQTAVPLPGAYLLFLSGLGLLGLTKRRKAG